ncbi:MAG: pyroglutamyl-peptidase I [Burkholderiales bacterium]|nr:pyroglutamyl-peptidase I [Burkholderiales bacterium]
MKALVTGFEPFGGSAVNASAEAVRRLPARLGVLEIVTAELPTSYRRSHAALAAAIERVSPAIVLCTGQANERGALCVERLAVNLQYAETADNDGARPADTPVVPGGPAAYLATLPVRPALAALQAAGLPAQLSMSAGTFVCNHVFYHLLHGAAGSGHPRRGGFLHVPALPGADAPGAPSMALDDIVRGIEIVLRTAAEGSSGG